MFICSREFRKKLIAILRVMIPILITQVAIMSMNFFDTVMSGQAGTNDLAGVAIGANIWMPVFTGINGLLLALTPIVAHFRGASAKADIPVAVFNGIILAILISLVTIVAGYLLLPLVLDTMTLTPIVRKIGVWYLIALATGIVPLFVTNVLRAFVDTMGYTQMTMRLFALTLPANVFLNWVFIFGKLGMPALGGIGAGVGSALTYWLLAVAFVVLIYRIPELNAYHIFANYGFSWPRIKEHLTLGIPMGTSIFFETSIFGVVALFISKFGTAPIAAHQAAMNFTSLLYMLPLSFSMALTILVGVEVGARRFSEAQLFARTGRYASWVIATIFAIFLFTCRYYVAELYSSDQEIILLAGNFLLYDVVFQFCDATAAPIQGILRGYKDVKAPFYFSLIAYWAISLPLGIVLDVWGGQGPYGYWQGLIAGIFFSALFLTLRLKYVEKNVRMGKWVIPE